MEGERSRGRARLGMLDELIKESHGDVRRGLWTETFGEAIYSVDLP